MAEPARPAYRDPQPDTAGTRSQTLDRGIRVLETLRETRTPMTIATLARTLGMHRSIIYRILRTLEDHRLVTRTSEGGYELGLGLAMLARGVSPNLQSAALTVLSELANRVHMTAFLVVPSGEEALTLLTVEPRESNAHIAHSPGMRHPLDRGAPGLALLAALAPHAGERPEVEEARVRGWAYSHGEVLAGMSSIAAPITSARTVAAVAVVFLENGDTTGNHRAELGDHVVSAAEEIMAGLP